MIVRPLLLSSVISLSMVTPAFAATTFDLKCMQNAVEKRESLFVIAFDNYYATTRSAMINRKDGLRNAWTVSDRNQRNTLIKNATKNYTTSEKNARKIRRDAEKQASRIYKADADACEISS